MSSRLRTGMVPGAWFLAAAAAMAVADRVAPGARLIAGSWRYGGLLLLAGGLGVGLWALALFQRADTTLRPGKTPTVLIEGGPYRFSRHPMYLGLTVALCGAALLLGSLTPWAVALTFFLLVARREALAEERKMERTFGRAYDRYRSRVRRWL